MRSVLSQAECRTETLAVVPWLLISAAKLQAWHANPAGILAHVERTRNTTAICQSQPGGISPYVEQSQPVGRRHILPVDRPLLLFIVNEKR